METETARQIEDALRKLDSMEKQLDSQQYLNAQIEKQAREAKRDLTLMKANEKKLQQQISDLKKASYDSERRSKDERSSFIVEKTCL